MTDVASFEVVAEGSLHCTKTLLNSGASFIVIDMEEFMYGDVEISINVTDC